MSEIGLYEAMSTLRAVRRLKPDPVDESILERVIEAASFAPTGGNAQPWRVIVVRDRSKLERLGRLYAAGWERYASGHRALANNTTGSRNTAIGARTLWSLGTSAGTSADALTITGVSLGGRCSTPRPARPWRRPADSRLRGVLSSRWPR